jgi:hypothetical protein
MHQMLTARRALAAFAATVVFYGLASGQAEAHSFRQISGCVDERTGTLRVEVPGIG